LHLRGRKNQKVILRQEPPAFAVNLLIDYFSDFIGVERIEPLHIDIGDIEMAGTTGAMVIAFHTKVSGKIKDQAKTTGVKLKSYEVIYKLIEDLQKQILKLIEPTIDEVVLGEAEIMQIFAMKGDIIAGSRVKTGEIKKTDLIHIKRGEEIIADPSIKSMMHGKEEISSVKAKNECGITFRDLGRKQKVQFAVGDVIVAYKLEDEE